MAPIRRRTRVLLVLAAGAFAPLAPVAAAAGRPVPTTVEDFHLPGTQVGDVGTDAIFDSSTCRVCHGDYGEESATHDTWRGSLMAHAARDPLFRAQMSTANQDAANVGYFCMRCHVPLAFVTEHAYPPDGSALDATDQDGVSCHFCHAMVDPVYDPASSPPADAAILAALEEAPTHYGNAMFVLDPSGTRRGPYDPSTAAHVALQSGFHRKGEFCGTCHDVGNVETSRQPDGSYRYNALDEATPDPDPAAQFPLERTYTEWKLSAFASDGVDMQGRFGGEGAGVIRTCQDCHMPRTTGRGAAMGPVRQELARHDFAGAAAPVLDLIAALYADDPAVDLAALARGRANAVSMLERAASLGVRSEAGSLVVRVTNETGHKLPTGHIEGRRVWIHAVFRDAVGRVLAEHGGYDEGTATLDEASTAVYEMWVGLSADAAALTGLEEGRTGHMSLADTIVKDNRIPPRGFENAAFAAAGAPVVAWSYAEGQHWDEQAFPLPAGAWQADVALYYQNTPREYIEHLRDGNTTDHWGETLYALWEETGRGAPIRMASAALELPEPPCTEVVSPSQTGRTTQRTKDAPGRDRLETRGRFTLPEGASFDPGAQDLVVTLADGSGRLWRGALAAGSFVARRGGRRWVYAQPEDGEGTIERAKLAVGRDGRTVRYELRARGDHRPLAAGTGSARVRLGDTCLVDPADACTVKQGKGACR
jgi:hypothetical protein